MGAEERQVAHAHAAAVVFFDQRHRAQHVEIVDALGPQRIDVLGVDQVDDLHVPRQHAFHQTDRPGFQGFGQQGVVGVRQGFHRDIPRGVPRNIVQIDQLAHQLGDGDRRVGVVELDRCVFAQAEYRAVHVLVTAQQVLQRGGDEEVFLAQPQFLPRFGAVGRVKHTGDALGAGHLGGGAQVVAGVETLQVQVFHGARTPQPQGVDAGAAPADHWGVVGHGAHGFVGRPDLDHLAGSIRHGLDAAAEANRVNHLGALELPWVAEIQPAFGLLLLPAIDDRLAEQAVFIADAITVAGNTQGRHAFHEAGGQTAQATVAERRVGLQHTDALKVHTELGQGFASDLQHAEVAQAVVEQAADEKFQGEVINPLLAFAVDTPRMVHPVVDHLVAGGQGNGFEPVMVEGVIRVFAHRVGEFGQDSIAKCGYLCFSCKRFLRHRCDLERD